ERGVHALAELLGGQPARGVMLAQQRRDAVAIRVRGADPRITRHRAHTFFPDQPTPADLPAFPTNRPRPTSRLSRPTGPADLQAQAGGTLAGSLSLVSPSRDWPPSFAVSTHGPAGVIATVCSKCAAQLP